MALPISASRAEPSIDSGRIVPAQCSCHAWVRAAKAESPISIASQHFRCAEPNAAGGNDSEFSLKISRRHHDHFFLPPQAVHNPRFLGPVPNRGSLPHTRLTLCGGTSIRSQDPLEKNAKLITKPLDRASGRASLKALKRITDMSHLSSRPLAESTDPLQHARTNNPPALAAEKDLYRDAGQ